jgi:20S proteasome subunit alpha 7
VQAYTLYSSVRPFGVGIVIGALDPLDGKPGLYMVEPSGVYCGYKGCATGKGKQVAKTELEKLKLDVMTCREAVVEAARMFVNLFELIVQYSHCSRRSKRQGV